MSDVSQTDLFSRDEARIRRNTDPSTSHMAAVRHTKLNLSKRRKQVLELVQKYPGKTQGELARLMLYKHPGLPINVCAATPHKRLPELEELGLVRRGDKRRCDDSSYMSATWWPLLS